MFSRPVLVLPVLLSIPLLLRPNQRRRRIRQAFWALLGSYRSRSLTRCHPPRTGFRLIRNPWILAR